MPEGWWCISLPFSTSSHPSPPRPPLLLQPGPAVSGTMWRHCTLSHALNGEREGGDGWIERSEFGVSRVIRPCAELRRRWRHQEKQKEGARGDIGWKVGQMEIWEGDYLRQNCLSWGTDKRREEGDGRLLKEGALSCPGAELNRTGNDRNSSMGPSGSDLLCNLYFKMYFLLKAEDLILM